MPKPAERIAWSGEFCGNDLHLVRGQPSPALKDRLNYKLPGLDERWRRVTSTSATENGLRDVTFAPRVDVSSAPGAAPIVGPDITVSDTGVISSSAPASGSPALQSFWLDVTAEMDSTDGILEEHLSVHVYIHDGGVIDAWLTPSPMTLRFDGPGGETSHRRPRLYVQFMDSGIADITGYTGGVFSTDSDYVETDGWGKMHATSPGVWGTVGWDDPWVETYEATVPTYLLPLPTATSATGEVHLTIPWEELPATDVTLVSLGGSYTAADADAATANILFLGDSFLGPTDLTHAARGLDRYIRTLPAFKMLGPKVRFWLLPLTSQSPDVTHLTFAPRDSGLLNPPETPNDPAGPVTTAEHMLHVGGYPPPPVWAAASAPTLATIQTDWPILYDLTAADLAGLTQAEIDRWYAMSRRTPVNDADSLFGVCRGRRFATEDNDRDRNVQLNYRRIERPELDRLLGRLLDPNGAAMGSRWTTGPDRRNILMCCDGHVEAANFSVNDGAVFFPINSSRVGGALRNAVRAAPSGHGVEAIRATSTPWTSAISVFSRKSLRGYTAHELGHALGLGDEYGDGDNTKIPDDDRPEAAKDANLILDENLFAGGALNDAALSWRQWHRITHAMMVEVPPRNIDTGDLVSMPLASIDDTHGSGVTPIVGGLGAYEITVQAKELTIARGHKVWVTAPGDPTVPSSITAHHVVFLRERLDGTSLAPGAVVGPLAVEWVDPATDKLVVREPSAGSMFSFIQAVEPAMTPRTAPILFVPVAKGVETDGYAKLMPKVVYDHLVSSKRPLDAPQFPGDPVWDCAVDQHGLGFDWPPMTNRPPLGKKKLFYARRVPALWAGGWLYDCGVYHSTSHSAMRGDTVRGHPLRVASLPPEEITVPPGDPPLPAMGAPNHFGPVCEYLLIDRFDPRQHRLLEESLARSDPD